MLFFGRVVLYCHTDWCVWVFVGLSRCGMVCGCTASCSPQVRCSARHTQRPPPWRRTSRRDAPSRCSPFSPASSDSLWLCWGEAQSTAAGLHLTPSTPRPPPRSTRRYSSCLNKLIQAKEANHTWLSSINEVRQSNLSNWQIIFDLIV